MARVLALTDRTPAQRFAEVRDEVGLWATCARSCSRR